jgi:hypothetical protein
MPLLNQPKTSSRRFLYGNKNQLEPPVSFLATPGRRVYRQNEFTVRFSQSQTQCGGFTQHSTAFSSKRVYRAFFAVENAVRWLHSAQHSVVFKV